MGKRAPSENVGIWIPETVLKLSGSRRPALPSLDHNTRPKGSLLSRFPQSGRHGRPAGCSQLKKRRIWQAKLPKWRGYPSAPLIAAKETAWGQAAQHSRATGGSRAVQERTQQDRKDRHGRCGARDKLPFLPAGRVPEASQSLSQAQDRNQGCCPG